MWVRAGVGSTAAASAIGAGLTHAHPTANGVSDIALALFVGVVVVAAASRARPWSWLVASIAAAAWAPGPWAMAGAMAAAAAVGAVALHASPARRMVGAVIGAVDLQVILHLPSGRLGLNFAVSAATIAALGISWWLGAGKRTRGVAARLAFVAGSAVAAAGGALVVAALVVRHDAAVAIDRARAGLVAVQHGDSDRASQLFEEASRRFSSVHGVVAAWWTKPALVVPGLAQQAHALDRLTLAGRDLAATASEATRRADVGRLKVSDGRVDLAAVRAVAAPLRSVTVGLQRAERVASRVRSPWLVAPVAERLDGFTRELHDARGDAATASQAVAVLPSILGGSGPRYYFIAFATPSETRDLGGFMGDYGLLEADRGKLSLVEAARVRKLNTASRGRDLTDASAFPAQFLALQPEKFWQDVTGTVDFPTVAEAIRQLWPQSGGAQLDGVVYVDPGTLAALLELTGPITIPGYDKPLTAANAETFLEREQYLAFSNDARHDVLVETASTVFKRLTQGDLAGPRKIADTLAPAVHERRLMLHSFHRSEQALFERLQLDGALPPVHGDFLSVRSSNRGLNKIDSFMQRTVSDDITIDPGRNVVRATVTVTVENTAPERGLPLIVIGNRIGKPAGTNSTKVSVYTPLRLVDVTSGGTPIGRGAFREYGRWVYTALLDVPAGGRETVAFELEGAMDLRAGYHLDVVPQPLVNADHLRVRTHAVTGWKVSATATINSVLDVPEHLDVLLVRDGMPS